MAPVSARSLACALVALAVLAAATEVSANADDALWHTMPLPGGSQGLASVLGLPRAVEPERVLPEAMRLAYDVPEGASDRTNAWRTSLLDYVSLIDEFERRVAAARARDGLRLQPGAPKPLRKAQRELLELAGFRVRERRDAIEIEPRGGRKQEARAAVLEAAGLPLDAVAERLKRGEIAAMSLRTDTIPLPLAPAFWASEIVQAPTPENRLFAAVLSDPKLLFTYHGLMSLGPATLAHFRDNPALIRRIRDDAAAAFAVFAGSLSIHDGRVLVPGGDEAVHVWQRLVDAPVTDVERFIRRLFTRDDGRLAMYFDAVAHMPQAQRRFALGLYLPPGERQREAAHQTWRAFAAANALVQPSTKPFQRKSRAAILLAHTTVESDGRPAGPAYARFWKGVFDGVDLPDRPERITSELHRDGPIDGAWMLDRIHEADPAEQPARARLWLFGQRVFAGIDDGELPDALVALRGFVRYEALLLTLERMGIRRPATFAAAVRRADALSRAGDREQALLFSQFQTTVALLQRLRASRSITVERADALIRSLADIPAPNERYRGELIVWLDGATRADDAGASLESRMISLVSGAGGVDTHRSAPVTWEGDDYRIDLAGPEREILTEIRQRQNATPLDTPLLVTLAARDLRAVSDPAAVAEIRQRIGRAAQAATVRAIPGLTGVAPVRLDTAFRKVAADLARIRRPKDLRRTAGIAERLLDIADILTADALASFTYAATAGRADADGLQAAALWRDHDFGFRVPSSDPVRRAWSIPTERTGTGVDRHVEGSFLALDLGLGTLALRRISGLPPTKAPSLTDADRTSLLETVVLANARDYEDDTRRTIIEAIDRGRTRASGAASVEDVHRIIADANLNGWRRGLAYWSVARDTFAGRFLSLAELYRLGGGSVAPADLRSWGVSSRATTGCLCLGFPEASGWEQAAGNPAGGWLPTAMGDIVLRVGEEMHRDGLPAPLTRGVLAAATYDYIHELQRLHPDDWMSMVMHAQQIPADRIADYVASLASRGPLVIAETRAEP